MTVTSVTVKHDGWAANMTPGTSRIQTVAGQVTIGAKVNFTVVYQVETDDRLDGPQIVAAGDVAGVAIPRIGTHYSFGNDVDRGALCKSIQPRSVGGKMWEVTCVFGPKSDQKPKDNQPEENPPMQDKDGQPTDNPMLAATSVQVSLVHMKEPVTQAVYAGQWWGRAAGNVQQKQSEHLTTPNGGVAGELIRALNGRNADVDEWLKKRTPVCNSVGTPFDPPIERDHARINLRITRNHKRFPVNDIFWYQDTVNATDIKVVAPNFDLLIPKHWGKMMSVSGTPAEINGFPFYRVAYEIHIEPGLFDMDDHPWRMKILDRGLTRQSTPEEDAAHDNYDPATGENRPGNVNIKDTTGQAISEPVLLNGKGKTLKGDLLGRTAVWLEYAIYTEADWGDLKLDIMDGFAD